MELGVTGLSTRSSYIQIFGFLDLNTTSIYTHNGSLIRYIQANLSIKLHWVNFHWSLSGVCCSFLRRKSWANTLQLICFAERWLTLIQENGIFKCFFPIKQLYIWIWINFFRSTNKVENYYFHTVNKSVI